MRQIITSYEDVMTFGKYKGKTIEQIADKDPSYIVWLDEEKIVQFPDNILDAALTDYMNNFPPEDFYWTPDKD